MKRYSTPTYKNLLAMFEEHLKSVGSIVGKSQKKKYYTYKETSEMLGITIEGLKSRIKRGQMQRTCNGNRPLISADEIDRWLKVQNPD